MSGILATYLTDVIPFRFLLNANMPQNGFLFGDENGPWKTQKLTDSLETETAKHFGFSINNHDHRHIAIAIDRKFIHDPDEYDEDDDDDDEVDVPNDLMATHGSRTANSRYARMQNLTRGITSESMDVFRSISDRHQKWLGLVPRQPRSKKSSDTEEVEKESTESKITKATRRLYGSSFRWRSEKQKEAVHAVVDGQNPLFVILPSGAGKTSCFLIPACFPDAKTTVVITPLVALGNDLLRRCKEHSVDAIIFGKGFNRYARVVIVVTETAGSSSFQSFIMQIHLDGKLDRIVTDEAHKLETDVNYRLRISDSKVLNVPVQFVFMTATYPPSMAPRFERNMFIEDPYFVREPTYKPNNRYSVVVTNDVKRTSLRLITEAVTMYDQEGKVLIFCKSIYPYLARKSAGFPPLTLVFTHKLKLVDIKIPVVFRSPSR